MPFNDSMITLILIGGGVLFVLTIVISLFSRYRMCPPDHILVVYGSVGTGQSAKCYHGGATIVWPIVQNFFLS